MSRVLIAEDDANFRRILVHLLRQNDFEILEARDGLEAVELATNEMPDVILMDVMMPRLDGIQATQQIRSENGTKNIPIIICTARDRKEDVLSAVQAGADDYIVKPSKHAIYVQKIRRALVPRARRMLQLAPDSERRSVARVRVDWSALWSITGPDGARLDFKTAVYDISAKGIALEFDRCGTCTGYELGTVHPDCLLAPWAVKLEQHQPVDLILMVDRTSTFEIQGEITHVYQPDDWPKTEIVGIRFTKLTEAARKVIEKHTY